MSKHCLFANKVYSPAVELAMTVLRFPICIYPLQQFPSALLCLVIHCIQFTNFTNTCHHIECNKQILHQKLIHTISFVGNPISFLVQDPQFSVSLFLTPLEFVPIPGTQKNSLIVQHNNSNFTFYMK